MKTKKRDVSIDIIKGIGIFLMVAGHGGAPFTHFIYLFHMAIFFIASGYLFNGKHSESTESVFIFFKRKIKSLWVPYVVWMTIFSLLHNFFIDINIYTNNPALLDYVSGKFINTTPYWTFTDIMKNIVKGLLLHGGSQIGSAMWFLATLMEINILYCLIDFSLKKLTNNNKLLILQGIISVIFLIIGFMLSVKNKHLAGYSRVFSFYILFYIGQVIKLFDLSNITKTVKTRIITLLLCTIILISMNSIGSIDLGSNSYTNPIFFLIVSCAGWQLLYEIAVLTKKYVHWRKIWVLLGQNTLSVVMLHFLSFKLVNLFEVLTMNKPEFLIAAFPTLYTNNGWWALYILAGLSVPIVMNLFWKKTRNFLSNLVERKRNLNER